MLLLSCYCYCCCRVVVVVVVMLLLLLLLLSCCCCCGGCRVVVIVVVVVVLLLLLLSCCCCCRVVVVAVASVACSFFSARHASARCSTHSTRCQVLLPPPPSTREPQLRALQNAFLQVLVSQWVCSSRSLEREREKEALANLCFFPTNIGITRGAPSKVFTSLMCHVSTPGQPLE